MKIKIIAILGLSLTSIVGCTKLEEKFNGEENEFLWVYCNELEQKHHHDYYISKDPKREEEFILNNLHLFQ